MFGVYITFSVFYIRSIKSNFLTSVGIMKKIKIVISLILIFIGLILVGELGIIYLENFANDLPNTTIFYQPGMDHNRMKDEVLEAAEKYNVDFFVIKQDIISINKKNLIIYKSNSHIENYLSEHKDIAEKEYHSLFSGTVNILFDDYQNISDSDLEVNNYYYVLGSQKDIKDFKLSLIDKYAGKHPVFPEAQKQYDYMIYGLWLLIFGLCLVFTAIYVKACKKDVFIKFVYGENRLAFILKEAIIDLIFIYGLGILILHILKVSTNTEFYQRTFYLLTGIFAVLNSLIYLQFYQLKIKKVYEDHSKITLSVLYLLKILSATLISLVIAINAVLIKESIDFISQESFFKEHQDYYYTNIGYIPRENKEGKIELDIVDSTRLKQIFYLKNFKHFNPITLANFGKSGDTDLVLANKNSLDYLKSEISSISKLNFADKCYYLIPQSVKSPDQKIEFLDIKLQNYLVEDAIRNKEIIYYQDKAKIITIDDFLPLSSKLSKNPIVILDNRVPTLTEKEIESNPFLTTYDRNIMYQIKADQFENFIKEYHLESEIHGKSNVYEVYRTGKLKMERLLKIEAVISFILIFLEVIILTTLIKLEFRINAYKISIKKLLGYNFWERYKKLIVFSLLGSILAILIFTIISLKLNFALFAYGIIIIAAIFMLEQILIYHEMHKIENHNIQLVLKGEFR